MNINSTCSKYRKIEYIDFHDSGGGSAAPLTLPCVIGHDYRQSIRRNTDCAHVCSHIFTYIDSTVPSRTVSHGAVGSKRKLQSKSCGEIRASVHIAGRNAV